MTERILYTCDGPGCSREIDEEGALRVVELTAFDQGAVNIERRHACSPGCEAILLRTLLDRLSDHNTYRDLAKAGGARERFVTVEGFTLLPQAMIDDLGVSEGGCVWFSKKDGRWSAYSEREMQSCSERHLRSCGTEYRGCSPDCPKERGEKWSVGARWRDVHGEVFIVSGKSDRGLPTFDVGNGFMLEVDPQLAVNNGCVYLGHQSEEVSCENERGWYVLPGKTGFDGAGWFETREAARQGLERDAMGPYPTIHEARTTREKVLVHLPPTELHALLRLAGRHVPMTAIRTWPVADQHEAWAWAAFTLSDTQLGTRRAPPVPESVKKSLFQSVSEEEWNRLPRPSAEDIQRALDVGRPKNPNYSESMTEDETDPQPSPGPSPIERAAGVRYAEVTAEERAAIDRIKSAACHLSYREKNGSYSDIITDITVAIVAEMRRCAAPAKAASRALDEAEVPDHDSIYERVQWLTRRAQRAECLVVGDPAVNEDDGAGWYAVSGAIGWFTNRARARARLDSTMNVQGPFGDGYYARSAAGETESRLYSHVERASQVTQWFVDDMIGSEVTTLQVERWSTHLRTQAVTWAAYTRRFDQIGDIRLIYDTIPMPPIPEPVKEAHDKTVASNSSPLEP